MAALRELGEVRLNPYDRRLTEDELCSLAAGSTVLVTHWGTPQITEKFLSVAPGLKLIAHCTGTVAHIASEDTYRHNIPCLSANPIMAKYVAEDVLGLMIAGLRGFKAYDCLVQRGEFRKDLSTGSLWDLTVGLVGLGTVGRWLLTLLAPFGTRVLVYDPYIPADALDAFPCAGFGTLDDVLGCDVISVHASQTPETYHIIGEGEFQRMKDNAVFINTARGSLVDTKAASEAFRTGRIRAAIDVYENEGQPQPTLMGMDNVILQPHIGSLPAGASMTRAILGDVRSILAGNAPKYAVSYGQFLRMTQE